MYLIGAAFASLAKGGQGDFPASKSLGFVGAIDNALVRRWLAGYQQGAEDTDPATKVQVGWAGSYTDPATSKELAISQAQKGAKYIAGVAAAGNSGVFEAAGDRDFFTSGVDIDERPKDPEHILLSMVKRSDLAVKDAVCEVGKDTFKGGDVVLGVKEGAVGPDFLTLPEDELKVETKLPADVQEELKAAQGADLLRRDHGQGQVSGVALHGIVKRFGALTALGRRRPRRRRGHGARRHRRERRRQDHADGRARRRRAGRRGRGGGRRRARGDRLGGRRVRARDRHGAPALQAVPRADGRRERGDGPRAAAPRRIRPRGGRGGGRRPGSPARAAGRPARPGRRPVGRRPAARGDPARAAPGGRRADPRRADRRARAAGGRGAVPDPARAGRGGAHDPVHLAQAARGAGGLRHGDGAAPRRGDRDGRHGGDRRAAARLADGRPLDRHGPRARAAPAGRRAARRRRAHRAGAERRVALRAGGGDPRRGGRGRQRADGADRDAGGHPPAGRRRRADRRAPT